MAWILLIEDHPEMRALLRDALARAGHAVMEAVDGYEGLLHAQRHPPDLAIVDLFLPDQNGVEIIRVLQRGSPQLPIMAISGGSPELPYDFLRIAQGYGAQRALRKPFTLEDLSATVEALLRERG